MQKSSAYLRMRELTRDNVLDELHPALRHDIVAILDELDALQEQSPTLPARVKGVSQ